MTNTSISKNNNTILFKKIGVYLSFLFIMQVALANVFSTKVYANTIKTGTVTATSLTVRSEAITSSSALGYLKKGESVEIVQTLSNGWHKIKYKSKYGYVGPTYISIKETIKSGYVNASSLTVRASSNTSSKALGYLKKNDKVEIIQTLPNGWHKINYKSGYGYVGPTYISFTKPSTAISVTSVILNKTSSSLVVGATDTLVATINPTNATNKSITWTSSNTKVATVNSSGKVTAIANGSATITVKTSDAGKIATCTVTVKNPSIKYGYVTTSSLTVRSQATTSSTALGYLSKGAKAEIVQTLSNGWHKIKYKSRYGYVGPTYISFTKPSTANSVTSVKLNKTSSSLVVGSTDILVATINPSNATNKGVVWTSSNTKVATVNSSGKVTAIANGSATITVKTKDGNKTASCKLTITTKPTTSTSLQRQQIIKRAEEMVNFKWTAPSTFKTWNGSKLPNGKYVFEKGKTYTGMPYTMSPNQMKTSTEFKSKIKAYASSGKNLTGTWNNPRFGKRTGPVLGNDCSGFITYAWDPNMKKKYGTSTLQEITKKISYNNLQPGDIINAPGNHVVMFVEWANSSKTQMVIMEQTYPIAKKHTVARSKYENNKKYTPLRWNKL